VESPSRGLTKESLQPAARQHKPGLLRTKFFRRKMEQKNAKTRGVRKPKSFRGMFYFLENDLATLLRFPAA
jgi:hypothetical protein